MRCMVHTAALRDHSAKRLLTTRTRTEEQLQKSIIITSEY